SARARRAGVRPDRRRQHQRRHDHSERQRRRHHRSHVHRAQGGFPSGARSRRGDGDGDRRERRPHGPARRQGVDRRPRHAQPRRGRGEDVPHARRRRHQHPDDLDLRDQDLGRRRRQVRRARGARAARRLPRGRGAPDVRTIQLYDTTLRDGCQGEDVAFTLEDKLRIAERLDDFGVHYLEGGWPGSNPRDAGFFDAVRRLRLRQVKVAAFGATRRHGATCETDQNVRMLLKAKTPVVTIVGRTWDLPVEQDLRIPLDANLELIADTIAYLRARVDEVIFDAEHFFDGYRTNPAYALACVRAAADAGACVLCLCDTRGGSLPTEVAAATAAVV